MAEEVPETEDGSTVEEPAAEDENTEGEDREDSDVASSEEDALSEDEVSSGNEATTEDVAPAEDKPTTQRTALVVQIGDQEEVLAEPNGQVVVPIELQPRFNDTVMTVATLEIRFDPTMVEPIACGENPDKVWEIAVCNPAYDNGLMRLSVLSTAGVSGANRIAEIEFSIIGSSGSSTPIAGTLISLVDENQEDISYKIEESLVVIE